MLKQAANLSIAILIKEVSDRWSRSPGRFDRKRTCTLASKMVQMMESQCEYFMYFPAVPISDLSDPARYRTLPRRSHLYLGETVRFLLVLRCKDLPNGGTPTDLPGKTFIWIENGRVYTCSVAMFSFKLRIAWDRYPPHIPYPIRLPLSDWRGYTQTDMLEQYN